MASKVMRMRARNSTTSAGKVTSTAAKPSRRKSCEHPSCPKQPAFSFNGSGVRFCAQHRLVGMVNVRNRRCEGTDCTKEPYFGEKGGKARFCATHKPDKAMVDVRHRRCEFASCHKQPNYGYEGQRACYCSTHKLATMVDVKHRRCAEAGCRGFSSYAFPGTKEKFCTSHRREGMVPSGRGRTAAASAATAIATATATAVADAAAMPPTTIASPGTLDGDGRIDSAATGPRSSAVVSFSGRGSPGGMVPLPRLPAAAASVAEGGAPVAGERGGGRRTCSAEERERIGGRSNEVTRASIGATNNGNENPPRMVVSGGGGDGGGDSGYRKLPRPHGGSVGRDEVEPAGGGGGGGGEALVVDPSSGAGDFREERRRRGCLPVPVCGASADAAYVVQQRHTMAMLVPQQQRDERGRATATATAGIAPSSCARSITRDEGYGVRPFDAGMGTAEEQQERQQHGRRRSRLESFGNEEEEDRWRHRRQYQGHGLARSFSSDSQRQQFPEHHYYHQQQVLSMPSPLPLHHRRVASSPRIPVSLSSAWSPPSSSSFSIAVAPGREREGVYRHHRHGRLGHEVENREDCPHNRGSSGSDVWGGTERWPRAHFVAADSEPTRGFPGSALGSPPAPAPMDSPDSGAVTPSLLFRRGGSRYSHRRHHGNLGSEEVGGDGNGSGSRGSRSNIVGTTTAAATTNNMAAVSGSRTSSSGSGSGSGSGGVGGDGGGRNSGVGSFTRSGSSGNKTATWADTALVSRELPMVDNLLSPSSTTTTGAGGGTGLARVASLNPRWRGGIPNARRSALSSFHGRTGGGGSNGIGDESDVFISSSCPPSSSCRWPSFRPATAQTAVAAAKAAVPTSTPALSATPWHNSSNSNNISNSLSASSSSSSSSFSSSSLSPSLLPSSPVSSPSLSSSVVTLHGGRNNHARLAKLSAADHGGGVGGSLGPTLETLELVF
ncbi:unnamed protein product [Pylaiella littoralis]